MNHRPRTSRRRALSRAVLALLPVLLISSGVAYADHQPNHDPGGNAQPGVDITICHATGSATNPYVTITINPNGLNGHLSMPHSGTDIVPAPAGGCPGPVTPPPPPDVCPNLDGNQATVPAGLQLVNGQCVSPPPPPTDVCPNLDGDQATVPAGLVVVNGQCVSPPATPDAPTPPTPETPVAPPATPAAPAAPDTPDTPDAPAAPEADTPTTPGTAETPDEAAQAGATTAPADDPTPAAPEAALPFTGAPTWIMAVLGFGLVLAGTLLHATPRRKVARVTN